MNKGKKNKKENDTFARFPSLRNANLLEFNFKVRETKQNKKRKCTRVLQYYTHIQIQFQTAIMYREIERGRGGLQVRAEGYYETKPTTNSAYKRAHNELHREPAFGMDRCMISSMHTTVRYPVHMICDQIIIIQIR